MKKLLNALVGIQSPLTYLMALWQKGTYIGSDPYGNKYYTAKARKHYAHERRWVRYASGNPEASEVPPEFHGWLHHQTNTFPKADQGFRQAWQQDHMPNATGTTLAYRPDGHALAQGSAARPRATGDYEAWTPQ